MQEIFLGEAVKKRRMELGISQQQLCEGICESITISRLENGKQTPSRRTLNALLDRLDMPTDKYYALLSDKEMQIERLWTEITAHNVRFSHADKENRPKIREETLKLHKKLIKAAGDNDNIINQHLICSQIILGKEDSFYTFDEQYDMLIKAIRMTSPNFDINNINSGLYTFEEVKIINQLALVYIYKGEHINAIEILSSLYKYIKLHFHNVDLAQVHLDMIIFNYANELYTIGQYKESLELAIEGKKIALDSGRYQLLPEIIGLMAECYHFLGNDNKSRDLFYQAYYLMKVFGNNNNLNNLIEDAENLLKITLFPQFYQEQGQG